jgi:lactate permease
MWNQVYNPLGSAALSTIAAAVPVVTLLVLIASGRVKAHVAAVIAVIVTNLIAIFIFTMPAGMSIRASLLGIVTGFFPIGWIVLNVIFLYQIMAAAKPLDRTPLTQAELWSALLPWIIVCVVMLVWGNGVFKTWANSIFTWNYPVPDLHNMINKMPPVVAKPTPEGAVFAFTYLSFTGTGMLIAAIISGLLMGLSPTRLITEYGRTIRLCAISLITISAMLAIGTLTRLGGVDATLGLAFAATGVLYPFFGTLLGWLGVALTGSDTASNILFGNLQKITSEQLGLSSILMGAANSSGGVMGKMIDAQSIVVASTATNWYGHEGSILRYVFMHSIVLACLVGILVTLQAYVYPFTALVLK